MKYSIVFSSRTGNTAELAEQVKEVLPQEDCMYFGAPDGINVDTSLLFVGFWTDKGTCDADAADFLKSLTQKQVFLFGTAGFGGKNEYFDRILASVRGHLDESNEVVGSFMCQGKMPAAVRQRYEKMQISGDEDTKINEMLENFDRAAEHPNQDDFEQLKIAINEAIKKR